MSTKAGWLQTAADKCDEMASKLDIRVVEGTATAGQARTMRDFAEALRLEASTGVVHCVCCRVPQSECPNRRAKAEGEMTGKLSDFCDKCQEQICNRCARRDYAEEQLEAPIGVDDLRLQVLHTSAPWGMTRHLVVERHDGKDGIPWEVLQAAKDEALGPDAVAVEIYPERDDVVNEVSRRHLWEVPSMMIDGLTLRRGS